MRLVLCTSLALIVALAPAGALAASLFPDMWQAIVTPAPRGLLAAFDAILQAKQNDARGPVDPGPPSMLFRILLVYSGFVGMALIVSRLPRPTRLA